MRIAHLTTVDISLEVLLGPELSVDVAAGHEVLGLSAPGPWVSAVEARGVRHVPLPSMTRSWDVPHDLRAARELWAALQSVRPDVLHTHTPKAGVLGRVLGRLAGVPCVVNTCHGLWAGRDDPLLRRTLVTAAEAVAARFSDAELYQNDEDRRRLRRFVGGRGRTVGNGVDLDRFCPSAAQRRAVRAELGVDDGVVLVGGVGRRVAEKGIVEFAAAARALAGHARFVWVGPADPDKPDAVEQVHGIDFVGLRHDMPAVYNALDVFVLPSYREGFSRSGMEAAACGCALVTSDIRGCRELGVHGRDLWLVPPRAAPALTAAVRRLIADDVLRARLAAGARTEAVRRFDQRRVAAESLRTYARVRRAGTRRVTAAAPVHRSP